jgi:cyanophycinase
MLCPYDYLYLSKFQSTNNMSEILKDEALAICGAKLHILPRGYKFDLKTRQPILNNNFMPDVSVLAGSANT